MINLPFKTNYMHIVSYVQHKQSSRSIIKVLKYSIDDNMTVSKATLGIVIGEALSDKPIIQEVVGGSIILLLL